MVKAKRQRGPRRVINKRRLHVAIQARLERSSPKATDVIAGTLERIATFLVKRSALHARDAGRVTVLEADARLACDQFLAPRQTMTDTATKLRNMVAEIEAEARTNGGNLDLGDTEST